MGRSYLDHRENISTSLQARSLESCNAFIWDEKFFRVPSSRLMTGVISVTEIIVISYEHNFYTLQNLCHSGKLYPASGKTLPHMNRTKLFDLSKCFPVCPCEQVLKLNDTRWKRAQTK